MKHLALFFVFCLPCIATVFAEENKVESPQPKKKRHQSLAVTAPENVSAEIKPEVKKESPVVAPPKKEGKISVVHEAPAVADAIGKETKAELSIRILNDCYNVSFDSQAGEIVSCTEALPIEYTKRECDTSALKEVAANEALVSCEGQKRITLHFKTPDNVVAANLRIQRDNAGKAGVRTRYIVESSRYESTGIAKFLKDAELKPLAGEKPQESPLVTKFSGMACIEHEFSKNLSYFDHPLDHQFDNSLAGASAHRTSMMANLNAEVSKDGTSLVSTLQFGETYFGDAATGGHKVERRK